VRSRTISILLLATLAAVVMVALTSAGQTPPPASGDWEIYDDTVISDTSVTIVGNVHVYGFASLTLINVDLTLDVTGPPLVQAEPFGRLTWSGGSLDHTSSVYKPRITLYSNCTLDGVTFGSLYGISIMEFGANVTNCTLGGTDSLGISISPRIGSPIDGPIVIADNTFLNMKRSPIGGMVNTAMNATVGVVIVGNSITGTTSSDAINLTVFTPSAHLVVSANVISNSPHGGIALSLNVDDLYLRLNANRVTDVGGDGVRVVINSKELDFPGIIDLIVDSAAGIGLSIEATGTPIDGLALINHTNTDAGQAAIVLKGAFDVTLVDSHVDTTATNFVLSHSTLDIYHSHFTRGSATLYFGDSRVTSWRWVELVCLWQGGIPVENKRVDVLGPVDQPMLSAVTDRNGYWGNQTYSDWTETEAGSLTVDQLTPVMVHPQGNVTDGAIPTDTDQDMVLLFEDPYLPTLVVCSPDGDVLQNSTEFHINGSCSDPHSGVALVQFSFDPNPDWDAKYWSDAMGARQWSVDNLYMSEGVYTLYMRAYDRAGLVQNIYANVTVGQVVIDLSPPVIQVTSPDVRRLPVIVNTSTIQVEGWVSEEVSSLTVQQTPAPVAGGVFLLEVNVSEGLNDITIVATDMAGNTARHTFSVIRDTVAPTITLTAPAEGALLNVTFVRVAGLVDEQVLSDRVVINGATAILSSGAFELLLSGFDQGPSTIDVTAVDLAGNTAILSVDVLIDTLPPVVEIVSPIDSLLTRQSTVLVEGTSEAGAHITVQGTPVVMTGTAYSHTVDLVEGRNVIHVASVDAAGNRNSTLVVVYRDSIAPVLEIYGLDDGNIDSEGNDAVLVGRTEWGALLWMAINGSSFQVAVLPDGSFIQPLTVDQLETFVTMRAEDAAGNTAFTEATILRSEVKDPTVTPSPSPVDPVITTAVVTATTLVIVGIAMTFEFTKYALILMLLPLYARIKKHEVLDNKTRLAIHGLVVESPGMHYNEIIREFDLTNGVAAYHLDVLEREGFIRSIRDGTLRRFYSSSTKVPGDHRATPDQTREHILEMVSTNPGINQKSIVDELGIGRTLVGYHLKTLIDEGYIEAHKQGRFTVYSRTRKRWFRLN